MPGISLAFDQSSSSTRIWAIVPGIREIVVVTLVVVALFGRSSRVRPIHAWASRVWGNRRSAQKLPRLTSWLLDHCFLVVATLLGLGVVAWVAMSWLVAHRAVVPVH